MLDGVGVGSGRGGSVREKNITKLVPEIFLEMHYAKKKQGINTLIILFVDARTF